MYRGKKANLNRRGFIKSSVLGTAGVFIGTTTRSTTVRNFHEEPVIIRRKLGKTDIELPIVSFGVMRSDNVNVVKSAFEMGMIHFDTAHGYQEGKNETMLGELFKEYPRDSFVLATKVSPDDVSRQTGELGPGSTRESILSRFEMSLNRLQMKYVDILYFHGISNRNTALAPQMLEAFDTLKKQGKVRYMNTCVPSCTHLGTGITKRLMPYLRKSVPRSIPVLIVTIAQLIAPRDSMLPGE